MRKRKLTSSWAIVNGRRVIAEILIPRADAGSEHVGAHSHGPTAIAGDREHRLARAWKSVAPLAYAAGFAIALALLLTTLQQLWLLWAATGAAFAAHWALEKKRSTLSTLSRELLQPIRIALAVALGCLSLLELLPWIVTPSDARAVETQLMQWHLSLRTWIGMPPLHLLPTLLVALAVALVTPCPAIRYLVGIRKCASSVLAALTAILSFTICTDEYTVDQTERRLRGQFEILLRKEWDHVGAFVAARAFETSLETPGVIGWIPLVDWLRTFDRELTNACSELPTDYPWAFGRDASSNRVLATLRDGEHDRFRAAAVARVVRDRMADGSARRSAWAEGMVARTAPARPLPEEQTVYRHVLSQADLDALGERVETQRARTERAALLRSEGKRAARELFTSMIGGLAPDITSIGDLYVDSVVDELAETVFTRLVEWQARTATQGRSLERLAWERFAATLVANSVALGSLFRDAGDVATAAGEEFVDRTALRSTIAERELKRMQLGIREEIESTFGASVRVEGSRFILERPAETLVRMPRVGR